MQILFKYHKISIKKNNKSYRENTMLFYRNQDSSTASVLIQACADNNIDYLLERTPARER